MGCRGNIRISSSWKVFRLEGMYVCIYACREEEFVNLGW